MPLSSRGTAIAALPATDDDVPMLERIQNLLQTSTKVQSLLKPILDSVLK